MAHSKVQTLNAPVTNLTPYSINVYDSTGEIVTLPPKKKPDDDSPYMHYVVSLDTYERTKKARKRTKNLVGASVEGIGRGGIRITSLYRFDDFARVYPLGE